VQPDEVERPRRGLRGRRLPGTQRSDGLVARGQAVGRKRRGRRGEEKHESGEGGAKQSHCGSSAFW
jgi:hypothetical protein